MSEAWLKARGPLAGLALSCVLCLLLVVVIGESPRLLWEAIQTTLFTPFGLGYTLFYTTPLIFTGLSVAIAYHCGLFNIGAEGQLYIGAVAIVAVATYLPALPAWASVPIAIAASAAAAGLWGAFPGWLKAKRGSHEVIVTILMNFISYSLVAYLVLYPLRNPEVQNPESLPLPSAYWIPTLNESLGLFPSTPVNLTLALAFAAAIATYFFLFSTVKGFEMRSVGRNVRAAQFAGISTGRTLLLAFALSGALAGGVGVNEVMGLQHHLTEGFSPGYGFTGIAVALLARSHPLGILLSAFLFGAIQNGSREIEFLSDKITKELAFVLQGVLIACLAAESLFEKGIQKLSARLKKEKA